MDNRDRIPGEDDRDHRRPGHPGQGDEDDVRSDPRRTREQDEDRRDRYPDQTPKTG